MNIHVLGLAALLGIGALAGCDQSNTGNNSDLASGPVDQASGPLDMAGTPADMTSPITLNGCDTASFVDRTASAAIRTVAFGGGTGNAYSPKCILIAAGQTVTFAGSFAGHPLRPGVGGNATAGSANNPVMATAAGTTAMFTFATAGSYPFNCSIHDSGGMNGVVKVQ